MLPVWTMPGLKPGECFTFYRFAEHHWKNIPITNALEQAFKEVRRRTNVIKRFPTKTAAAK